MAKNNNKTTVILDFTAAYNAFNEYLETPSEGYDKIPKLSLWERMKRLFKR